VYAEHGIFTRILVIHFIQFFGPPYRKLRLTYCTRSRIALGVTMNNSLKFSKHIAKVTAKGHIMANLILKCFLSRDANRLVRAFTTYVRPRLEYCSVVWNPVLKKDIENLEKVQRRFTKRLTGLQHLT